MKRPKILLLVILLSSILILSNKFAYKKYVSKNKYTINFPTNWRIDDTSYSWFAIYSYTLESITNPGLPVGPNELKIECYLKTKTKSSYDEILKEKKDILDKENIIMNNGKQAIKILRPGMMSDKILTIYYYDGFKLAIFNCWPYNSKYKNEFFNSVKSFEFNYYYTTVNNLRLREKDNLKSNIIKNMNKNERVDIINIGKIETINNIKGKWVEVITEYGETGWCFDGYLKNNE